jgi:hypothetical protein
LKKTDRAFALFQKVQEALGHVPNLTQAFDVILDAVIDQMDVEKCSIMVKDPVSGDLSLLASRGKEDGKTSYHPDPSVKVNWSSSTKGLPDGFQRGPGRYAQRCGEEPRFVKAAGLNNNVSSLICFVRENDQVVCVQPESF